MTAPDQQTRPNLEQVMQVAPCLIYIFNQATGSNEYSNRSIIDFLGYSEAEARAMGSALLRTIVHADDFERVLGHLDALRTLPDGELLRIAYRVQRKDGAWIWLSSTDTVFDRDAAGAVTRHMGVAIDVTTQKDAEVEALRARDAERRASLFLKKVMDSAKSAIIALDRDATITSINAEGRRFLGCGAQEAPFAWPDAIRFLDRDTHAPLDVVARAVAGEGLDGAVALVTAAAADLQYVRVSSAAIPEATTSLACVLILDDVTEQERNRQRIERTSRLDALGQLTGGIAHDFNNLLATVQYALQLADFSAAPAQRRTYIQTAQKAVTRGADLTKRLLAFAKQQPGLSRTADVDSILEDLEQLASPLIEASVTVEFKVEDARLWITCDLAQLTNALVNLLINARDAIGTSGEGGRIMVRARAIELRAGDVADWRSPPAEGAPGAGVGRRFVEFSVTDDGPGMSEAVKLRAIDPFFTTKPKHAGSGLGLATVYGFCQQAGGDLRIYSELGQGTTVRLLLPQGDGGVKDAPGDGEPVIEGGRGRVLIVEDEPRLLMVMKDLVASFGYEVETASSGDAALEALDALDPVDVVITDVVMPGRLNGFALAKEVRARRPDMPLLYISGYAGYRDEDMGAVVAPMLQKPCAPDKLAEAIKHALATAPPRTPD